MKILKLYSDNPNQNYIDEAVEALRAGEIVIYPTDTLYALGCDALNNRAIERLCRIKGINPDKNLLSVVCDELSQVAEYARVDNRAFRLLKEYLPGPFTFVLPASTTLPKVFKGRKTVGVRIPDNNIARALARALGHPVLSSSVELEDEYETPDGEALGLRYEGQPEVSIILDGGEGGFTPSTVVDCTDSAAPEIIRQGAGKIEL
ncbi:MAG: threonylcarbamoyl-AMP synthase [Bacteroidales bacterium]|nr:threonylcarbamoyl-AMP synthase [Bacteroidales bacterium]